MTKFSDLQEKTVAWLGSREDEKTIHVEFGDMEDDGRTFWVINGAWDGVLYEEEDGSLCLVDDHYGGRHHPIYIVEIDTTSKINPVQSVDIAF